MTRGRILKSCNCHYRIKVYAAPMLKSHKIYMGACVFRGGIPVTPAGGIRLVLQANVPCIGASIMYTA